MLRKIYEGPQTGVYSDGNQFGSFIREVFSNTGVITLASAETAIMLHTYLTVVHYHNYYNPRIYKDVAEVKLFGNWEAFEEIEKIILREAAKLDSKVK